MISIENFRDVKLSALDSLTSYGFKRCLDFETTTPTFATIIYCGKHVAFKFGFDIRTQRLESRVVSVVNGALSERHEGGFSCGIYRYLIERHGYRGGYVRTDFSLMEISSLNEAMLEWMSFMELHGAFLLEDAEGSLS